MSNFQINGIPFPTPVIKNRPDEVKPATLGNESNGTSFGDVLENAIQEVSSLQQEAGAESQKLLTGNTQDIHSAMVALQKAAGSSLPALVARSGSRLEVAPSKLEAYGIESMIVAP